MDLEAFVAANSPTWKELDRLTRSSRLSPEQATRFVDLYERSLTHLSIMRSNAPDPTLVMSLSSVVSRARRRIGSHAPTSVMSPVRFLTRTFPAVLYQLRAWWLWSMVISLMVATLMGYWLVTHPELHDMIAPPEQIRQLVENDFADYYSSAPAQDFALHVWTNNSWVATQCIALGITGVGVIAVLWSNMTSLAISGALMVYHGHGPEFFGLILPHGALELTSVFVAAGAGLALFWSWVAPGDRTRAQALARQGRMTVTCVIGLVLTLFICGILEAFITPAPLITPVRIGIGLSIWGAFMCYALVWGRRVVREGDDGDLAAWQRDEDVVGVSADSVLR